MVLPSVFLSANFLFFLQTFPELPFKNFVVRFRIFMHGKNQHMAALEWYQQNGRAYAISMCSIFKIDSVLTIY